MALHIAKHALCVPCPAPVPFPLQGWNCVQVFEGHSHYVMQVWPG